MTLSGTQKGAVYLAAAAALASVFSSSEIRAPFELVVAAAFIGSYFWGERFVGRGTLLWNSFVVVSMVFLGAEVVLGSMDIVLAATYFAILLLINRLYNRRSPREHAQLHLTMLLTISGGAILSADLGFGVAFLVFCVAATWSLTLTHLRSEIEDEAKSNQIADGGRSVLQSNRLVSARFLGLLSSLATGAIAAAIIVFILFPRVSIGIFSRRAAGGGTRTGYSGQVELGGAGIIKDDARIALRVFASRWKGTSLGYYWRGATMDFYDGRAWHDSTKRSHEALLQPSYNFSRRGKGETTDDSSNLDTMTLELVPDASRNVVFTTGHLHWFNFVPKRSFPPSPPMRLMVNESGDLGYAPIQQSEFRYEIRTSIGFEKKVRGLGRDYPEVFERVRESPPSHPWDRDKDTTEQRHPGQPPDIERFTQLPSGLNPRIIQLGRKLAGDKDPSESVDSVVRYLSGYEYSLQMTASGEDPLSSFLFDVKSGHCEYFATALAVLLRAGGVPTRMVTGYYGGKYIKNGDYYAVREGDAHTWVEVYFPGVGWRAYDATPVAGREAFVNGVYEAISLWVDGMRTQWRNLIVEYDLATQVRAIQGFARVANELSHRLSSQEHVSSLRRAGVLLLWGLVLCVAVALIGFAVYASRRSSIRSRPEGVRISESRRFASRVCRELLARLARRGIVRRPSQTIIEFASEVEVQIPDRANVVRHVVDRYVAARYGHAPLDAAEARDLQRELRRI